jgi:hypothetical protein
VYSSWAGISLNQGKKNKQIRADITYFLIYRKLGDHDRLSWQQVNH